MQVNRPLTMIKTQIHSRRRKPTKVVVHGSSGQGHSVQHDNNSNQSDPGHFTPGGTSSAGSNSSAEALDMSTAEVKGHDDLDESYEDEVRDLSAEDQSPKTNELNQK